MGKALLFGSPKGGVGKTTKTVNLAVMFASKGITCMILKADKNPELAEWNEDRKAAGLPKIPIAEAYGDISSAIKRYKKLVDVLIVDCAGHDSAEFRSALTCVDILLAPVKPSSKFEAVNLTELSEIVRDAQHRFNPKLQAWTLVARVTPRKLQKAIELEKELKSEPAFLQPLRTRISELDVFEEAANLGAGVHEMERASSLGKAKAQLELLAAEIGLM
ncbi:peptidyl-arginine deiminase [Salmonella enterica]